MSTSEHNWNFWNFIHRFFPFQLLVAHLKYNFFSLLLWSLLFLFANDSLGYSFGVPLLFLSPEYLGTVSPWSFLILGFSIGGFIMGFNTFSYMKLGPYFPFLTTLSKPFLKFCINNSLIPVLFGSFIIYRILSFQMYQELSPTGSSFLYVLGFISGIFIFLLLSFFYFFRVGGKMSMENSEDASTKPISSVIHKREKWYDRLRRNEDRVYLYIGTGIRIQQSRSSQHFDRDTVEKVFAKNKINASLFELMTILSFFILGAFNGYPIFEVPAGASIVLLLTIFLMLFSALHSWFKGWIYPLMVAVLFCMNFLSERTSLFDYTNYAYGLNYDLEKPDVYSIQRIQDIAHDETKIAASRDNYIQMLNAWKEQTGESKPKLIILNVSGGGSRSALWTMLVLQHTDSLTQGKLGRHIQMITGASGGMIGAAYFRELLLEQRHGKINDLYNPKYSEKISQDMLNKLSFMASTNDIFIRYQKFAYGGYEYTKDRGYAFEAQLHENTDGVLDHNLAYYAPFEKKALIPTMIFSPTIVNDGRRLLISSQALNFLTVPLRETPGMTLSNENIDMHSLLENQNSSKMRFSTALRASATFPFVMPMVTMPTQPEIQLMDAGIRDNYGAKTTMEFLNSMKEWIHENTSGVIVLQIRDTQKILDNESYNQVSFMDKITLPFGNMYKNFPRVQDFNNDELMLLSAQSFDFPIDLISFNLRERKEDRISLSWHLTGREKIRIKDAFSSVKNQAALSQLQRIL